MNTHRINAVLIGLSLMLTVHAFAQSTTAPAPSPAKRYLNLDWHGVALHGYDPVAYFTQGKPIKGDKKFSSDYRGAIYRFASAEDKALFDSDPTKYEPQFGGFCAYAVSQNRTADIQPDCWSIIDGRLLVQNSPKVVELWNKDVSGHLKAADQNWPAIANENGK